MKEGQKRPRTTAARAVIAADAVKEAGRQTKPKRQPAKKKQYRGYGDASDDAEEKEVIFDCRFVVLFRLESEKFFHNSVSFLSLYVIMNAL